MCFANSVHVCEAWQSVLYICVTNSTQTGITARMPINVIWVCVTNSMPVSRTLYMCGINSIYVRHELDIRVSQTLCMCITSSIYVCRELYTCVSRTLYLCFTNLIYVCYELCIRVSQILHRLASLCTCTKCWFVTHIYKSSWHTYIKVRDTHISKFVTHIYQSSWHRLASLRASALCVSATVYVTNIMSVSRTLIYVCVELLYMCVTNSINVCYEL